MDKQGTNHENNTDLHTSEQESVLTYLRGCDIDIDLSYIETIPQKDTNRCWLISAISESLSRFRKKTGLSDFMLSLNYLAFWDCIEKCRRFFDNIIQTSEFSLTSETVQSILQTGIDDGGDWLNAAEIIFKYGVVPEESMPETEESSNTEKMYTDISRFIRYVAKQIREADAFEQMVSLKETAISEIYAYLTEKCGIPPETIEIDSPMATALNIAEGKITAKDFSGKIFFQSFFMQISFVSIDSLQAPQNTRIVLPYNGYRIIRPCAEYINIDFSSLKEMIVKQLIDGHAVPISCDTRYFTNSGDRIFDIDPTGGLLRFTPQRLGGFDYKLLRINHSMLIVGMSKTDDNTCRWKIANSWAETPMDYYYATDRWFDAFVFEAIISQRYYFQRELDTIELLPNTTLV